MLCLSAFIRGFLVGSDEEVLQRFRNQSFFASPNI
jgi:uncharacterized membrane protein YjjP (DUF1212 family)